MDPSASPPIVTVTGFDHLVLNVADAERSLAFYCGLLGLAPDRVDEWRAGEVPFPSVRIDTTTIVDLFPQSSGTPTAASDQAPPAGLNLDHLCLTIEPTDLNALAADERVEVIRGPQDKLFGAQGYATSLYIADPDGNTVELRAYETTLDG